jgi:hypothetical protein
MRSPVFRFAVLIGALALAAGADASAKTTPAPASLTLYEKADFAGRHVTFHSATDSAHAAFTARSARSTGVWTLCEGRDPASKCQTVNGPAAKLKVEPSIARPGVDAVALYEEAGLKGRRVVYSFASDQPPPFAAKSARTWGGPWTLCDAAGGRCQTISGEHPEAVDIQVSQVQPGRSGRAAPPAPPPARLQIAMAVPPTEPEAAEPAAPAAATDTQLTEAPAPPPAPAPVEVPVARPAPPPPTPAVLADAAPAPKAEAAESPYVDIPLPPRPPEAPSAEVAIAAPPPAPSEFRAPEPRPVLRQAPPVRRVAYDCADGRALTVLFDDRDQSAMVLAGGQDPVAMRRTQTRAIGGFFYEGQGHALFGAGARAGYATDGSEPVDCYARGARRQLSYQGEQPYGPRFYNRDPDPDDADEAPDPDASGRW